MQHLRDFKKAKKQDFAQIFGFSLDEKRISNLLIELKNSGKIFFDGPRRSKTGYWRLIVN